MGPANRYPADNARTHDGLGATYAVARPGKERLSTDGGTNTSVRKGSTITWENREISS